MSRESPFSQLAHRSFRYPQRPRSALLSILESNRMTFYACVYGIVHTLFRPDRNE